MWELAEAHKGRPDLIEEYLRDGYEPFAVSTDNNGFSIIWLRREVKVEVPDQQPKPNKRPSRRIVKDF